VSHFDPEKLVRAQRVVSVRDLARGSGKIIDEVERNEAVFVLGRHGRMVALITPLPERTIVEIEGRDWLSAQKDAEQVRVDVPDAWKMFTEIDRAILATGLDHYPTVFPLSELAKRGTSAVSVRLTHLEMDDLVERTFVGRRLTAEGREAAMWVRANFDRSEAIPSS
jgi:antitoxin (DNA-binding transcriptional repressor) of toxin-antitoxin stability system